VTLAEIDALPDGPEGALVAAKVALRALVGAGIVEVRDLVPALVGAITLVARSQPGGDPLTPAVILKIAAVSIGIAPILPIAPARKGAPS
jgi:hypothetical protein